MRGRGAAGKVPVFGLLKRGGRVYTKIIPDASSANIATDYRAESDSRQYRLFGLLAWLQRAGRVGFQALPYQSFAAIC